MVLSRSMLDNLVKRGMLRWRRYIIIAMTCTLFADMNVTEGIIYILIGLAQNVLVSDLWG